jgi:hypothetical protein
LHQSIISSFLIGHTSPESIAYADWFQSWIDRGNRLDLVIDLPNIQSGEGPHVFCPLMEGTGTRGTLSFALHRLLLANVQEAGYGVQANPLQRGWMPDRLSGWLTHYYGPISIAYEINSQAPERHLTVAELKMLGTVFVQSAGQFFATPNGKSALSEVDSRRIQRAAGWTDYLHNAAPSNAIVSESEFFRLSQPKDSIATSEKAVP